MFGSVGNGKYSNVLTVLLVIVMIAIVGLLIYLGIDVYRKYYITKEAGDVITQFDEMVSKQQEDEEEGEPKVINESDNDPLADLQDVSTSNQGGNSTVMYEGFVVKGTIKIPKTGIEYPILERVTKRSIEVAVAIQYGVRTKSGW